MFTLCKYFIYNKSVNLLIISALPDLVHASACAPLALPYIFSIEKMEFLGQSPSLRREERPAAGGMVVMIHYI